MKKLSFIFCTLALVLIFACTTQQVGLKENWIDERDVIALASGSAVSEWMVKAGRPTLVEINGDTSMYYYNYKPTMYATTIYDSTKLIKAWNGSATETKPGLENATEVWGSRKNIMQIKVVKDVAISAVITTGPDKKTFIRDLNGNLILDPTSGYNSNISVEQKIGKSSEQFKDVYGKLHGKDSVAAATATAAAAAGTNMSPWEYYRYKQQLGASEKQLEAVAAESTDHHIATEPVVPVVPAEPDTEPAVEPVVPQPPIP